MDSGAVQLYAAEPAQQQQQHRQKHVQLSCRGPVMVTDGWVTTEAPLPAGVPVPAHLLQHWSLAGHQDPRALKP